jgi:predicted PurR-regulated permease PerM
LQLLGLVVASAALLYLLAPVLTPFAVAALLGYLGDPLVDRLEQRRFSRTTSVMLVFTAMTLAMILVLLLLIPILEAQISQLIRELPAYVALIRSKVEPWLVQQLGVDATGLPDLSSLAGMLGEHWQAAGGIATSVVASAGKSGMAVLGWLVNLALIPVLTFYFLRDWDTLVARINELLPRSVAPTIGRLAGESDQMLGAFLRGQLTVMAALATIYTVGLWAVGVDYALLIGLGAGLVSFIPYLGTITGLAAGLIAAGVQHQDLIHLLLVLGVFGIAQMLEGFVLTPWLVGDRIGLHPVAVIFAIMAGGQLFGFFGVLLGLPVAAVAMVALRYLHDRYMRSELYVHGSAVGASLADLPATAAVVEASEAQAGTPAEATARKDA